MIKLLNYYEKYFLPVDPSRPSLLELKKQEFRLRKKLLNPIMKEQAISSHNDSEHALKLSKKVDFKTMYDFTITFDRHKGRYPP